MTFANGSETALCPVTITDDHIREANETFLVKVAIFCVGRLGTQGNTTVTIVDNEGWLKARLSRFLRKYKLRQFSFQRIIKYTHALAILPLVTSHFQ